MQQFAELKIKDVTVPLKIVRSKKNKHIRFTVTETECRISMPLFTTESKFHKSLKKYENWIYEKFKKMQENKPTALKITSNSLFPFKGKFYKVDISSKYNSCQLRGEIINLPDTENLIEIINHWYLHEAYKQTINFIEKYNYLCTNVKQFRLKPLSSRWGSCSEIGNVTLNWRLILGPSKVFEYVFIHELCHFKVQNHSRNFWNEVQEILPDYAFCKQLLKQSSHYLMNFPNNIRETNLSLSIKISEGI